MSFDPEVDLVKQELVFADVSGEHVSFASANPINYVQAVADPGGCASADLSAVLFVPPNNQPNAAVIVVPGSVGISANHASHAELLVAAGYVVLLVDPFGPRAVASTVADQTQYSFAASAFDVLASFDFLAGRPEVDDARIGAQGHSRGGSAVTTASMRVFADAILGPGRGLAVTYAVYPWCGHQFVDSNVGSTVMRAIIGDQDEWCSIQQVQAQFHAIAAVGGKSSCRIVRGAHHSFDRLEPVHVEPDAKVAPEAPTVYLDGTGAMIDHDTGEPDAGATDRDAFVRALKSGFGRTGARLGGEGSQPDLFKADMLDFFASTLQS